MNWLQKTTQVAEVGRDIEQRIAQWDAHYPRAGSSVGGLAVGPEVPNTGSISAGMNDWYELPGIREVPLADFGSAKPHDTFYAANDIRRSRALAEEIRNAGWVAPLIVGIDSEEPYLLEGLHRFVALGELGITSFPAVVVIELD